MSNRASPQSLRHIAIRKEILHVTPHATNLRGNNRWTAVAVPVLLLVHWAIAAAVGQSNFIICFVSALFIGQIIIHQAGTLLHETAHRLVFHNARAKLLFDLGLEIILASYSKQLTYQYEHVTSHHAHLGDYENDYEHEDICHLTARTLVKTKFAWTQRVITWATLLLHALPLGFLISGEVIPRIYEFFSSVKSKDDTRHIRSRKVPVRLRILFIVVSTTSNFTLYFFFGGIALLYHVWSLSLFLSKFGVTNLGQSLSEHEGDNPSHPTYSDYRFTNLLLFNTGYHNEHHTFPDVAWVNLPRLKKLSPKHFSRENPRSYFALWLRHIAQDFSPTRVSNVAPSAIAEKCGAAKALIIEPS